VHKDNSLPQTTPSWQDLDDAINTIERITLKYVKGIKAVNLTSLYSETKLNWDEISGILNGLSTQS
jgi:hypothetical protein